MHKTSSSPLVARPLKRGKACLTCRFLKIKCDGERPICGPCERNPKDDPCEYADGPGRSRAKMLEEQVAKLEARIRELEDPNHAAPSMILHDPYATTIKQQPTSPVLQLTVPVPVSSSEIYSPSSPYSAASSLSQHSTPPFTPPSMTTSSISPRSTSGLMLDTDEPSMSAIRELLTHFFNHATEFGFFLNVAKIFQSAQNQAPLGSKIRPIPALMRTLYLWGAHLSRSDVWINREPDLLMRALSETGTALNSMSHPHYTLQLIQTEVLLSYYFFRAGRSIEARKHATSAASIVLSCGLHKVQSNANWQPTDLVLATNDPMLLLISSEDTIEEGEKINGFWAVLTLCKNVAAAFEHPANVCGLFETPGLLVDTPWPLDMETYKEGILPPRSNGTVADFLNFKQPESAIFEHSLTAMYSKASILFHRATYVSAQFYSNMQPAQQHAFNGAFDLLIRIIEAFSRTLPPASQLQPSKSTTRTIILTHALLYGASIRLHRVFAYSEMASRQQCLAAARAMLRLVTHNMHEYGSLNPIMGTLWMTACQVIIDEIAHVRASSHSSWSPTSAPSSPTGSVSSSADAELVNELQIGLSALSYFSRESALMSKSPLIRDIFYSMMTSNPEPTNFLFANETDDQSLQYEYQEYNYGHPHNPVVYQYERIDDSSSPESGVSSLPSHSYSPPPSSYYGYQSSIPLVA